jgi:alanine dehydrogenase
MTAVLALTRKNLLALDAMDECIAAMADGFAQLARGEARALDRTIIQVGQQRGRMAIMPGVLEASTAFGVKVQCTFTDQVTGAPAISGIVALHDGESGRLLAILDSRTVTELRTAAGSAVATRYLAREDATELALLGSGAQARAHLEAIPRVRTIERISLWSRTHAHAEQLRKEIEASCPVPVRVCTSPEEATRNADIICVATRATTPVLMRAAVPAGAHINSVGSYGPTSRELDGELVTQAHLYVDALHAIQKECGDILIPINEGRIDWSHVRGELGNLVLGNASARETPHEITLYKSIGTGIADVAAADSLYRKALMSGHNLEVNL